MATPLQFHNKYIIRFLLQIYTIAYNPRDVRLYYTHMYTYALLKT